MMPSTLSTARLLLYFITTLNTPATALLADCSTCDESQTAPVYYGCIGSSAYVTYDSAKVDCGAALSLDQTASAPNFHYPNADAEALYALILIDTTDINPIVGTVPPFLPFPVIHYGALNIPGDVLIQGLSMDTFHYDDTGIRVQPFMPYKPPKPSDSLSRVQPGYTPPDVNTRAFNHEFILGEQARERDLPNIDENVNWEFIGFLRKNIVGDPVASTYITTGYCVNEVTEEGALGSDCLVPDQTASGIGSVPAHVAIDSSGTSGAFSDENISSGGSNDGSSSELAESSIGTTIGSGSGSGSLGNGTSLTSGETNGVSVPGVNESSVKLSNSAFENRFIGAAAILWMVTLMYGMIFYAII